MTTTEALNVEEVEACPDCGSAMLYDYDTDTYHHIDTDRAAVCFLAGGAS